MTAQDIFEEVGGGNAFVEGSAFEFKNEVWGEHSGVFSAINGFGFGAVFFGVGWAVFGANGADLRGDFGGGEEVADFCF
jgi:hypothetical protein